MAAPVVTIVSVDRTKISHIAGVNQITVKFKFDVPVQAYSVNILGVDYSTGTDAGSQYKTVSELKKDTVSVIKTKTVQAIRQIDANTEITEIVEDLEVGAQANDGTYRVNIYGKGLDGVWTPYNQA